MAEPLLVLVGLEVAIGARLAQGLEFFTCNEKVAGSIPATSIFHSVLLLEICYCFSSSSTTHPFTHSLYLSYHIIFRDHPECDAFFQFQQLLSPSHHMRVQVRFFFLSLF